MASLPPSVRPPPPVGGLATSCLTQTNTKQQLNKRLLPDFTCTALSSPGGLTDAQPVHLRSPLIPRWKLYLTVSEELF